MEVVHARLDSVGRAGDLLGLPVTSWVNVSSVCEEASPGGPDL